MAVDKRLGFLVPFPSELGLALYRFGFMNDPLHS